MALEDVQTMAREPTNNEIINSMELLFKGDLTQRLRHLWNLKYEENYKPEIHHKDGTRYVVEVHGAFCDRRKKLREEIEHGNATFVDENGDLVAIHGHNNKTFKSYAVKGFDLIKMLNEEEMKNILGRNGFVEAHLTKSGLKIVKTKEPVQYTILGFDNKPLLHSRHKLAMVNGIMYSIYGGRIVQDVRFPRDSF
ncbi:hypothetical protein JXB27_01205 [Candidatus Woesearchaeota archaeon]|nr:hypothetical protein [Candidatus Woesearchaeota archaeon]